MIHNFWIISFKFLKVIFSKSEFYSEFNGKKVFENFDLQDGAFKWGVINSCWIFSDYWVRPHNHLCLPSRDWPIFWIRNFVYFCQSGDGRQQSEKIQQEFITLHMKAPSGKGLKTKCQTFLNAWKQMCSAGDSVPRNEFKLISPVLNSTKWKSLRSNEYLRLSFRNDF